MDSNNNSNINNIQNEIICIYNKKDKESIDLFHDYSNKHFLENYKESYTQGRNNINEKNIEIYMKDKKIKFNYKYENDEIGLIKI